MNLLSLPIQHRIFWPLSLFFSQETFTYSIHNGFGSIRITLEGALRHRGVHAVTQRESVTLPKTSLIKTCVKNDKLKLVGQVRFKFGVERFLTYIKHFDYLFWQDTAILKVDFTQILEQVHILKSVIECFVII